MDKAHEIQAVLERRERAMERYTELDVADKNFIIGIISEKLNQKDNKKPA